MRPLLPPLLRVPAAFLLALALLVGALASLQGRTAQFWTPLSGVACERFVAYDRLEEPASVVVLGTSLTMRGISATLLADLASRELGEPVEVFNLASPGTSIRMDRLVLRDLILQRGTPRLLLVEAGPPRFNRNNDFNEDFDRFYAMPEDLLAGILDGRNFDGCVTSFARGPAVWWQWWFLGPQTGRWPARIRRTLETRGSWYGTWEGGFPSVEEERIELLRRTFQERREVVAFLGEENLRLRYGEEILRLLTTEEGDRLARDDAALAALPTEVVQGLELLRLDAHISRITGRRVAGYEIDAFMRREWEDLLRLCEEHDIRVVAYDPPRSQAYQARVEEPHPAITRAWQAYLREWTPQVDAFVPKDAIVPELEGLYRDGDHLMAQGCLRYTTWLWENWLQDLLQDPGS